MNVEQLKELQGLLTQWREERHLTTDMQVAGYIPNMLEELTELYRAKDESEKIDALCDMIVFTLNAFPDIEYSDISNLSQREAPLEELILSGIDSYARDKQGERWILGLCVNGIKELDYCPYLAMLETIKEISSRTGRYDEVAKKFIKDAGAYNEVEARKLVMPKDIELGSDFDIVGSVMFDTHWDFTYTIGYNRETLRIARWYKADYLLAKKQGLKDD